MGRPLPQAAHVESRVVAPAAGPSPVHGSQPVAPLVQRPNVGDAAQVPAQLQEAARVLVHPPPPLAELGRGQALRGQRGCRAAVRRRPAARHQQQDSRLLEGFPDSADAEGDFPRQRRAQPPLLGGEQRGPAAADRRRPDQAQPALRRGGQQPQPVSGEIRRLHQAAREDVCAGHEAAAGAPLQQQHLIVEGAERGARQPRRRARRQQQRRRFPPVPQPPVHREGWRRRWPRPRSRSGAARAPPPPGLPEERLQPGAWAGKLGGLGRAGHRAARPAERLSRPETRWDGGLSGTADNASVPVSLKPVSSVLKGQKLKEIQRAYRHRASGREKRGDDFQFTRKTTEWFAVPEVS